MKRRWFTLLSLITVGFCSVIVYFIAVHYKHTGYIPKFRLSESRDDKSKGNSRETLKLRGELMTSIAKNSINLRGPFPSSLEFDIMNKEDDEVNPIKVFDTSFVEMPGVKGYTHVFKDSYPISRYMCQDVEQSGLPTYKPIEAVLTYFKEGYLDQPPIIVCTVYSVDKMEFECYLKSSYDSWEKNDELNQLDPSDEEYESKSVSIVTKHYGLSPSDDSSESNSKLTQLEIDISMKDGKYDSFAQVSELSKLNVPGFRGYKHKFNRKLIVTKYKYDGLDQYGLKTGTPLEAVITFFKEDHLDDYPLVVCPVESSSIKTYQCYLMDSPDVWKVNGQLSQLRVSDHKFGSKVSEIVNNHYLNKSQYFSKSYPDYSTPYNGTKNFNDGSTQTDFDKEIISEDGSTKSELNDYSFSNDSYNKIENYNQQSEDDTISQQENEYQQDVDYKTEDSNTNSQKGLTLDIGKTNSFSDQFVQVSEFNYISVNGYKLFSHTLKNSSKILSYTFNGNEQSGLPTDKMFESVLTMFKDDRLQDLPVAVCPVVSLLEMKFECYLRDSHNKWIKNDKISQMDITNRDFNEDFDSEIKNHYGISD